MKTDLNVNVTNFTNCEHMDLVYVGLQTVSKVLIQVEDKYEFSCLFYVI